MIICIQKYVLSEKLELPSWSLSVDTRRVATEGKGGPVSDS